MDVVNSSIVGPEQVVAGSNLNDFTVAPPTGGNDAKMIQAVLDKCAAAGGGTVKLSAGTYQIGNTLVKPARVSISGAGMRETVLNWTDPGGGVILDTSNMDLRGTEISKLMFSKNSWITADVTGILGGSTLQKYNSAIGVFKDLFFSYLKYGIRGNAEPTGVGIFDSTFQNIWCDNCFYGLWMHGSSNTVINPRMTLCQYAMVLDYLNPESYASIQQYGGTYIRNGYDYLVPNANGTRPTLISGTWHESSSNGMLSIPNAGTRLMGFKFENCLLSTFATDYLLNFTSAAVASVVLDNCTVIQTTQTGSTTIARPANLYCDYMIRNCLQIGYDGSWTQLGHAAEIVGGGRRKITTGSIVVNATQNAWATATVSTASMPFTAAPLVFLQTATGNKVLAEVSNITATGFQVNVYNYDATANVTVQYLAIGS